MKGRTLQEIKRDELPFFYKWFYECPYRIDCSACKYLENKNGDARCVYTGAN